MIILKKLTVDFYSRFLQADFFFFPAALVILCSGSLFTYNFFWINVSFTYSTVLLKFTLHFFSQGLCFSVKEFDIA